MKHDLKAKKTGVKKKRFDGEKFECENIKSETEKYGQQLSKYI